MTSSAAAIVWDCAPSSDAAGPANCSGARATATPVEALKRTTAAWVTFCDSVKHPAHARAPPERSPERLVIGLGADEDAISYGEKEKSASISSFDTSLPPSGGVAVVAE